MVATVLLVFSFFPILFNELSMAFPRRIKREWGFLSGFAMAALTIHVFLYGSLDAPFLTFPFGKLGLALDVLSGMIATTVLLIGASVMKFSERYMQEDPEQKHFLRSMALVLSSILVALQSLNLMQFWLAWVVTSYFLHKLLVHYKHRPEALRAARQKFWISRLGDTFLVLACANLYIIFGTLDIPQIIAMSGPMSELSEQALMMKSAALFLVLGSMTKSAQFPFHFWLPKTMETPTPVSALMHAGIINAGGYLIIRMGGFLSHSPTALFVLAFVGGFTAIYGTVIMLTQSTVKRSLAFSTVSQMGFMMLQCGLGAFSVAVVHIIGHAFYKAYGFLSAASATDQARLNRYVPRPSKRESFLEIVTVAVISVLITATIGFEFGYHIHKPGAPILLLVLGLAVAQIWLSFLDKKAAVVKIISLLVGYFLIYKIIDNALEENIVTSSGHFSQIESTVVIVLCLFFVYVFLLQNNLSRFSKTKLGKILYVNSLNGGFFGR